MASAELTVKAGVQELESDGQRPWQAGRRRVILGYKGKWYGVTVILPPVVLSFVLVLVALWSLFG